jgi:hypothetical protein
MAIMLLLLSLLLLCFGSPQFHTSEFAKRQLTAFLMQVQGQSGDIAQKKAGGRVNDAIHNNTFDGYHTGLELQADVSGVANILAGKGSKMDRCLVPALISLLGASEFAKVMEMLDSPINKHNFEASTDSNAGRQTNLEHA